MDQQDKVEDFSVDYLLPVRIGTNWVGLVYRDNESAMVLMDGYDITNKAILCDPSFDARSLNWFRSNYDRLKIVPDEVWKVNPKQIESRTPSMTSQGSPCL